MNDPIMSPDELIQELGRRIKERRGSMSQTDLAAKARVSRRALVDLESGNGSTLITLARVMKALGLEQQMLDSVPRPTISPMSLLAKSSTGRTRNH